MSRVLVVANETVGAEELLAEIRSIDDRRTSRFFVLAPAVPGEHGMGTWSQAGAIDAAQGRLDQTLSLLRAEGLQADGQVGDMVPLMAMEDALRVFPADMIVISTHPEGRSRWLRRGLVDQARRKFGVQVVHVVSHVHEGAHA
jgi:GABA permease